MPQTKVTVKFMADFTPEEAGIQIAKDIYAGPFGSGRKKIEFDDQEFDEARREYPGKDFNACFLAAKKHLAELHKQTKTSSGQSSAAAAAASSNAAAAAAPVKMEEGTAGGKRKPVSNKKGNAEDSDDESAEKPAKRQKAEQNNQDAAVPMEGLLAIAGIVDVDCYKEGIEYAKTIPGKPKSDKEPRFNPFKKSKASFPCFYRGLEHYFAIKEIAQQEGEKAASQSKNLPNSKYNFKNAFQAEILQPIFTPDFNAAYHRKKTELRNKARTEGAKKGIELSTQIEVEAFNEQEHVGNRAEYGIYFSEYLEELIDKLKDYGKAEEARLLTFRIQRVKEQALKIDNLIESNDQEIDSTLYFEKHKTLMFEAFGYEKLALITAANQGKERGKDLAKKIKELSPHVTTAELLQTSYINIQYRARFQGNLEKSFMEARLMLSAKALEKGEDNGEKLARGKSNPEEKSLLTVVETAENSLRHELGIYYATYEEKRNASEADKTSEIETKNRAAQNNSRMPQVNSTFGMLKAFAASSSAAAAAEHKQAAFEPKKLTYEHHPIVKLVFIKCENKEEADALASSLTERWKKHYQQANNKNELGENAVKIGSINFKGGALAVSICAFFEGPLSAQEQAKRNTDLFLRPIVQTFLASVGKLKSAKDEYFSQLKAALQQKITEQIASLLNNNYKFIEEENFTSTLHELFDLALLYQCQPLAEKLIKNLHFIKYLSEYHDSDRLYGWLEATLNLGSSFITTQLFNNPQLIQKLNTLDEQALQQLKQKMPFGSFKESSVLQTIIDAKQAANSKSYVDNFWASRPATPLSNFGFGASSSSSSVSSSMPPDSETFMQLSETPQGTYSKSLFLPG